jgi:hypothetical protein
MTQTLEPSDSSATTESTSTLGGYETPLVDGDTVFTVHLRWFVALCSAAAGLWHIIYAFPHIDHHVILGQTFLAVGIIQIAWAMWLLRAPSRLLLLAGTGLAVGSLVMWVFAHSTGISWYPGLEVSEIIGWGDTVTKWFEWFVILGAVALLLPKSVHQPAANGRANSAVVASMLVAIAGVLAINYIGAYNPEHADGGDHLHGPAEAETTMAPHDH